MCTTLKKYANLKKFANVKTYRNVKKYGNFKKYTNVEKYANLKARASLNRYVDAKKSKTVYQYKKNIESIRICFENIQMHLPCI